MKNEEETDAFCDLYGYTIENKVLGFILCSRNLDFSAIEIASFEGISKPKVYEVLNIFLKKEYIRKSRVVGKTQLYKLNKEHPHVKIFLRNFWECLKMVAEEYSGKEKSHKSSAGLPAGAGTVSARHV